MEQLLTTGGGWQDQIGGLTGGFKLGVSGASLPLFVEAKDLSVGEDIIQAFNERLVLIYTGKTRLARNLLQVGVALQLIGIYENSYLIYRELLSNL